MLKEVALPLWIPSSHRGHHLLLLRAFLYPTPHAFHSPCLLSTNSYPYLLRQQSPPPRAFAMRCKRLTAPIFMLAHSALTSSLKKPSTLKSSEAIIAGRGHCYRLYSSAGFAGPPAGELHWFQCQIGSTKAYLGRRDAQSADILAASTEALATQ
eukprot:6486608-Amphidinium_carterae.1